MVRAFYNANYSDFKEYWENAVYFETILYNSEKSLRG